MSNIKMFRTTAGQDFIGKLVEETNETYVVEKVMFVAVRQADDRMQVELMPIMPPLIGSVDGQIEGQEPTVTFNRGSILFSYNPAPELIDNYSQRTSTIQLASSIPNRKNIIDDM